MRISLVLLFSLFAVGCAAARLGGGSDIGGSTWVLTSIQTLDAQLPGASVSFGADGLLSGTTGCNRFTGTYEAAPDGALTLGPLATTRMACAPDAMAQERSFLDALAQTVRADLQGDRLVLHDADGTQRLTFEAARSTTPVALTGTVSYLPRIALPPDALVSVRLLDERAAGALATTTFSADGRSVPIPFRLAVDPDAIDARHAYVLRADIRDRMGALLWTTDTAVPVLTNGAPASDVDVRLLQVTDEAVGTTVGALVGPSWRVLLIEGPDGGVTSSLDWPAPYTLRFEPDGRYSGQLDCNQIGGTFKADEGGALELTQGLSTLAACPPGSDADEVLRVLNQVDRYAAAADRLELGGEAGTLVLVRDDASDANTGALPGPEWHLTGIQSSAVAGPRPDGEGGFSITFLSDGRFIGRADCNLYGGTFRADSDGALILTNPSTTIAACAPPSSSHAFFGILNQVVGFGVSNGRLTLRGADGGALVFEREGWMPPQETGQDMAFTCASPEGPFTVRTRTGPGEIALWLPERFAGRAGGTYLVLGQVVSASGAKYQDGPVTVWTKGEGYALLEVDGQEFLACPAAPERAGRVLLRGTGDGWYLEVTEANGAARLHLVGAFEDRRATATVTQSADRTVYRADGLVVTAVDQPCTDTDSGESTDIQVAVELDGRTHLGCGSRAE